MTVPIPAALFQSLFDSHPEPTFSIAPDGTLMAVNRAFAHFVGQPPAALPGTPLVALLMGEGRERAHEVLARLGEGQARSWEAEFRGPDETVSVGQVTLAPVVVDGAVVAAHGVARDLTVYRVIEEQLASRVFVDPLTGLANRTQLHEAVERAMRRDARPARLAILYLDLDDFKLVNDGMGHAAGDALLVEIGERLRSATRGRDTVARLGGDEFAVLLDRLDAPDDAEIVVARVLQAIARPLDLGGQPVQTSASLGVAHWDGVATPAELLRNADLAMYRAKTLGKGRHVVFDDGMQRAARERLELASALREGLRRDEIVAAFQPIVDLATGRVVKAEALARWEHATRGTISPGVFVPLAEETGLIEELGERMLTLACAQLARWEAAARARGAPDDVPHVAVNVSGRQIERGSIVASVRAAIDAAGVAPHRLTLELTESVALRHPEHVLRVLAELRALGVGLAIDDFGTGYSSLSYLHRFPVDILKIDKSFIDGLGSADAAEDRQAESLVRTVLGVAQALGLRTVAEGVETAAQRDRLRALGCQYGQGYLFGRPGPADRVA